jgi:hypothetical protein
MSKRSEETRTSAAGARRPDAEDLTQQRVELEEAGEASNTRWAEGTPPSPDEIRLRAYYRYMERQGGEDDEIGDWLAAESELRQRGDTGREHPTPQREEWP